MDEPSRLQHFIDKNEILECLTRYTRGIDRHDDALLESAFHPDAWVCYARPRPVSEFLPLISPHHQRQFRAQQHVLTNHSVDIDGDIAHSEVYVRFHLHRRDEDVIEIGGGRYLDRFERRAGSWRIADRVIVLDWAGRLPQDHDPTGKLAAYRAGLRSANDLSYRRPLSARSDDYPTWDHPERST